MRKTYKMIDGVLVEIERSRPAPTHNIMGDMKPYISPVTGREVDGRYARREDLKRAGCREVDPSEFKTAHIGRME